jgi:hypothetical protein
MRLCSHRNHRKVTCQNPDCSDPVWIREVKRGKVPALCPVCRATARGESEEDEEETIEVVKDYSVFSSLSMDAAIRALAVLQAKYRRTEFYMQAGEESVIMLRRNKYGVRYSPAILDIVRSVAMNAGV